MTKDRLRPNLAKTSSFTRDDDDLYTSWQSPSKRLYKLPSETPSHNSHSSLDLTRPLPTNTSHSPSRPLPERPQYGTRRRKSLLRQSSNSQNDPLQRQAEIESRLNDQLLDVFFTVHSTDGEGELLKFEFFAHLVFQMFSSMSVTFRSVQW